MAPSLRKMFGALGWMKFVADRVHMVPCNYYHAVPMKLYHTKPYNTVPYHAIPYDNVPYNAILYHTIKYNWMMVVSEMQDSKFDWIGLFHEGAFFKKTHDIINIAKSCEKTSVEMCI